MNDLVAGAQIGGVDVLPLADDVDGVVDGGDEFRPVTEPHPAHPPTGRRPPRLDPPPPHGAGRVVVSEDLHVEVLVHDLANREFTAI